MKILLAIDGSASSKVAIDEIEKRRLYPPNAAVRVVSAVAAYETGAPSLLSEYYDRLDKDARERAITLVETTAARLRKLNPDLQVSADILAGRAARAIVEEAEDWGADLIVVGSHGFGGWKRAFLGSVSDVVVHHAPCSVEIVRPSRRVEVQSS